jgi:hypothetical protein
MLSGILPILADHRAGPDWWSFGGGTALAVHLGHRVSYDIDIFLDSSRELKALTPNANPLVKQYQGNLQYEYPGNYLKLYRPGGEIDFIVATAQTDPGSVLWEFNGAPVMIETPIEIVAKKIFYRPSRFKLRDAFDLAVVLANGYTEAVAALLEDIGERIDQLIDRLELLAPIYDAQAAFDISPTDFGRQWMRRETAIDPLLDYLTRWREARREGPGFAMG